MSAAAAASPLDIDWALIRSKMMTEAGRTEADKARDAFHKRVVRVHARGQAAPAGRRARRRARLVFARRTRQPLA